MMRRSGFRIPFAKIELDPMELGKSNERHGLKIGHIFAIAFRERRQNVVAMFVPRTDGRPASRLAITRNSGNGGALTNVRWDLLRRRQDDRWPEVDLVEINGFLHGLEEAETEHAVPRASARCLTFEYSSDPARRVRRDVMADDAGAIMSAIIRTRAVPRKEDRAGTSAAVELGDRL